MAAGGAASWVQAIGTIIAAFFAWRAYSTWRAQDDVKRRAAKAEELLLLCHRVARAIRSVRRVRVFRVQRSLDLDALVANFDCAAARQRCDQSGERIDELRAFHPVLRAYFSDKLEELVVELEQLREELNYSLINLELWGMGLGGDTGGRPLSDEIRNELFTSLATVGTRVYPHYTVDADVFEEKLATCLKRIESSLGPHIVSDVQGAIKA